MRVPSVIPHDSKDFDHVYQTYSCDVPEYLNLGYDLCDKHADEPSKVALLFEDDEENEQKVTFGELIQLSNRFANVLKGVGVLPGDRVSIVLKQRPETVVAHLGTYKFGAIVLPLSVLFQKEALEYRLQNSGAKAVVVAEEDAYKVREVLSNLPELKHMIVVGKAREGEIDFWKALDAASSEFQWLKTKANDPSLLVYTSGTTGPPKGALHAHRVMLGHYPSVELCHNFFPKEGDVFWSPADWAWVGGIFDALYPCLHYGVPILAYRDSKFDPEKALYMLNKYGVTCTFIWPTGLRMMREIKGIKNKYSLRLRSIASGGESVGDETLRWARDEFGITVNEFFGQTEANYVIGNCSVIMKVKPGSMGKAYPGHRVELIDKEGSLIEAPGTLGEVACRTDNPVMMLGYWRNEATKKKMVGKDWWRYGDRAKKDEEGYFWFEGRDDDIISSAGYRIGPGEIENCLLKHPAVAQAAAVGSPDETRGEIVKAFIKLNEGYTSSDDLAKELQEHVKKNLAFYEYPREVEFIEAIPMTTTGKIRRIELKQREIEKKQKASGDSA
jgi:acetyl-CoA synthetase